MDAGLDGTVLVGHADAELGVVGQSKQHMKTKDTVLLTRNHGHVCMRQERGNVVDYVRHGSLGGPCAGGYMAALVVLKVVPGHNCPGPDNYVTFSCGLGGPIHVGTDLKMLCLFVFLIC
eukprot:scaffold172681_cov19-Tisochrysis_lutea.AAC.1